MDGSWGVIKPLSQPLRVCQHFPSPLGRVPLRFMLLNHVDSVELLGTFGVQTLQLLGVQTGSVDFHTLPETKPAILPLKIGRLTQ